MKRKFSCMLLTSYKKNGEHIHIIDKISSDIIEGIQLIGGDILSISMNSISNSYGFLYTVFYEDNNQNEKITDFLKKFHFDGSYLN